MSKNYHLERFLTKIGMGGAKAERGGSYCLAPGSELSGLQSEERAQSQHILSSDSLSSVDKYDSAQLLAPWCW